MQRKNKQLKHMYLSDLLTERTRLRKKGDYSKVKRINRELKIRRADMLKHGGRKGREHIFKKIGRLVTK